jgi:DNA-binding GntR family transcriptional regulator
MSFPTLERNGISISRIDAILSSCQADPETLAALGLSLGSPILVYEHRPTPAMTARFSAARPCPVVIGYPIRTN